jgi:TonB family protein
MTSLKGWKDWEGGIVDGRFPLRKYLGGSDHSVVFLTELAAEKAAIKLIPAETTTAERQLASWKRTSELSHPHLLRVFHSGRVQVAGADVLYVVMEHAEEDLSQVVPERALTTKETRTVLAATLDAISFVHSEGLVHGHLRPSNIMAVADQVKISSDTLLRASEAGDEVKKQTVYDPPEGVKSAAGDVWSLGVTTVEVLTQRPPDTGETEASGPVIPEGVPAPFRDFVRRCLQRDPEKRWTANEFAASLQRGSPPPDDVTVSRPSPELPAKRNAAPVGVIAAIVLVILVITWLISGQPESSEDASNRTDQVAEAPLPETAPPLPPEPVPGRVVSEAIPNVPRSAMDTITGTVRVAVRVSVDDSGRVTEAEIETPGPSRYFARLALESSDLWTFAPPQIGGRSVASEWTLRFGFRRTETIADAVQNFPASPR